MIGTGSSSGNRRSGRAGIVARATLIVVGALTAVFLVTGCDAADGPLTPEAAQSDPAPLASGAAADPASPRPLDLAGQLREATDLRAFAVEAGRHPELGGISYAQFATSRCWLFKQYLSRHLGNRLPEQPGEDPSRYAKRRAMYQRMQNACRNVEMTQYLGNRQQQGDTILRLSEQAKTASASRRRAERRSALAAVLANGDPLLLEGTLVPLVTEWLPGGRATGYWIDGKLVPTTLQTGRTVNPRTHTYATALKLLPCRIGLVCDERDVEVFGSCVSAGKCYADRIEMARDAMPPADRPAFDQDLDWLERAVRNRDLDRLLPAS
jgi:hypothetical protein